MILPASTARGASVSPRSWRGPRFACGGAAGAKYDTENPAALRRLVAGGTHLQPFTREVMEACYKAAYELYDETAEKNPRFKKIYEAWKAFRDEENMWFRVAEYPFDSFMLQRYQASQKRS